MMRLPMRKIREVLRLRAEGFSGRLVAQSLSLGWTCPDNVERLSLYLGHLGLEFNRRFVGQSRMPSDGIVEPIDVSSKCVCGLLPSLETGSPHQFRFDGLEYGLDHSVIVAIALATHRRLHTIYG